MAEYLPPVVTILEGEIGDFLRMIAEAKGALDSLAATEEHVQHAMDAKSAAADVQSGRLEGLAHSLALTAGANQFLMHAEEELGYRTTVTSVYIHGQTAALTELGNRLAITAGQAVSLIGAENNIAEAMTEKTRDAFTQAAALDHLSSEATGAAAKMGAITIAEGAAAGAVARGTGAWAFWGITITGWLSLIHLWLVLFAAQTAADIIGFAAFGIAAARDIGPAVSAVGNLAKNYQNLDPFQKAAALSLSNFVNGLQHADEAGVFGVFYQGLALIRHAMSGAGGITTQATQAFSDFFAMLQRDFRSGAWADLFAHGAGIIRKDMDALFGLFNRGINLIPTLFHDFNSLGIGAIHVVSGFLGAAHAVLGFNATLTKTAALATAGYAAYKILWSGLGRGPGLLVPVVASLRTLGARVALTGSYMSEGLGVAASYGIGMGTLAGAFIGAGIAAAGLLFYVGNLPSRTDQLIGSLKTEDQALGNNAQGYRTLATQLGYYQNHLTQATGTLYGTYGAITTASNAMHDLSSAQVAAIRSAQNITTNERNLGQALGLTAHQVNAFATATGVDLTKALHTGSAAFGAAAAKIHAYAKAVELSHHPMSVFKVDVAQSRNAANTLTQQVNSLGAAFAYFVQPLLNVDAGQIQLRNDIAQMTSALHKSNDTTGLATQAQRNSAAALVQAANDALKTSSAIKQQTGSTRLAAGPLQFLIKQMEALHIQGAIARDILAKLKAAEDALYNKTITIRVNYATSSGVPYLPSPGQPGQTVNTSSTAGPGVSTASPGTIVNDIHVHLDGRQIYRAVQTRAVRRQKRTGNNGLQRTAF